MDYKKILNKTVSQHPIVTGLLSFSCLVLCYYVWVSAGYHNPTRYFSPLSFNQSVTLTVTCHKENITDTNTNNTIIQSWCTCSENFFDSAANSGMPTIYFVTPTISRREQFADLVRLAQTLMHVPNLHWIIAEDADSCNQHMNVFLNRYGIPYTYLSSPMPDVYRAKDDKPRGVSNRRAALHWIRKNGVKKGVLFFGDDDNTYDLRLFDEIRYTKRVSMFPVGLINHYSVSAPIVQNGKVIGFFDSYPSPRMWPVDMAGFAVSLEYLEKYPNATMPYKRGVEEDGFLQSIELKIDQIEPKANNCTDVLVWHTQTKKKIPSIIQIDNRIVESNNSSLGALLRTLHLMNVSHTNPSSGAKAMMGRNGSAINLFNNTNINV